MKILFLLFILTLHLQALYRSNTIQSNGELSLHELILLARSVLNDLQNSPINQTSSSQLTLLIYLIITQALKCHANDIHLESYQQACIIRFRMDGELLQCFTFDAHLFSILSSQFKFLAQLDIAEKRKTQDGQLHFDLPHQSIDFRLSTLRTLERESLVLRMITPQSFCLQDLGFELPQIQILQKTICKEEFTQNKLDSLHSLNLASHLLWLFLY